MNDNWSFEGMDEDVNSQANTNKGLRGWAESVQKNNAELQKQLADVQKQLAAQRVSSVFEDLGVPRSAAALYQGDADPEAIKSWVTNVRSAFGIADAPLSETTDVVDQTPVLTPGQQNLFKQLNDAGGDGRPSTGIEDFQRNVNQAGSVQDLIANFQNLR